MSGSLDPFIPTLKIRIGGRSEATFDLSAPRLGVVGAGPHPRVVTVSTPKLVLGRGVDASLPLTGPSAKEVSRAHLLLQVHGGLWTFADLGSTNGTRREIGNETEPQGWRTIGRQLAPVAEGMTLLLADSVFLSFTLEPAAGLPRGETTDREKDPARAHSGWIEEADLEDAALALLQHRRADRFGGRAATVPEMMQSLGLSEKTVYRRIEGLRDLAAIEAHWRGQHDRLADLLEQSYPYLGFPAAEPDSPDDDATITSGAG